MARVYDKNDVFWSYEGDFDLDERGDLRDTSFDSLRSIKQEILTRIMSSLSDWRYSPGVGSDMYSFVGQKNTREVGQALRKVITNSLMYDNLINIGDVDVKIVPISANAVAGQVILNYLPTRRNAVSLPVTLSFLYDYIDNQIFSREGSFSK